MFFPPEVKKDVFAFYAYVRTADDFVDAVPQDASGFHSFVQETRKAWETGHSENAIIQGLVELAHRKKIERSWIEAFLHAMEMDLTVRSYETFADLEQYVYGSAEVIGLCMAQILDLPQASHDAARLQGKAMQLINFIRDIREDIDLGRVYIPEEDLEKFGMRNEELGISKQFENLIRFEIDRYREIQKEASQGYSYIPRQYRIPIQTAASMYNWTAEQICKNPAVIFQKKVKPTPLRVVGTVFYHFLFA